LYYPYESGITHNDLELTYDLIRQHPELQEWWEEFSESPERLHPDYGRDPTHLDHLRLNESNYDKLADDDRFDKSVQLLGQENLGPHIFEVWYHRRLDRLEVVVNNAYEIGFGENHMPEKMMDDIIRRAVQIQLPGNWMGNNSKSGAIMDIALALMPEE
jgi:hypothetical protein